MPVSMSMARFTVSPSVTVTTTGSDRLRPKNTQSDSSTE